MNLPVIKEIKKFYIPDYQTIFLNNGISCHILNVPDSEVIKMEVVFDAGRFYEKKHGVAKTTASLLKEGTEKYSSKEIAENIDFYGASLSTSATMDISLLQLYTLEKYFDNIMPIAHDIITEPSFNESELEKYKRRNIENLKIELSKNEVLAYRHLTEKIYGDNHPYGYNTQKEDYENIVRSDLIDHFTTNITAQKTQIFITGNINDGKVKTLNKYFCYLENKNGLKEKDISFDTGKTGSFTYSNNRQHQTSIRIGRRLFNRSHEDYPGMYLLNTILGGYFGSRLNANIREDKGYTYGIYSMIDMMIKDGYFMISTDVGNEYLDNTLKEIHKEIDILKTEPVSGEELHLVKNYIKGNFLSMVNGPLHSSNLIKTIELSGLGKSFYSEFLNKIDSIDSNVIIDLANKYLQKESLTEIIVGAV